jgi:hypothetical protein
VAVLVVVLRGIELLVWEIFQRLRHLKAITVGFLRVQVLHQIMVLAAEVEQTLLVELAHQPQVETVELEQDQQFQEYPPLTLVVVVVVLSMVEPGA